MTDNNMNRRNFLKNTALGAGALGAGVLGNGSLLQAEEKPKESVLKIKEYRTLGRTGFKVSDISTGYVNIPAVLEQLLDAGVNYIDTAEVYKNEKVVGSVIKNRDRKKLFVTTKLVFEKDLTKAGFLARTRKCLERLQTDYVDCMMIHSCEKLEHITNENFHAAMKQLKSEGRVKHVGISNHGGAWTGKPEVSMEKILGTAAMDGRFDVMLLVHNFLKGNSGDQVLKICREKNIGTTLMKVNPVGILPRIRERVAKMKKEGKKVSQERLDMMARLEENLKDEYIIKHKLQDFNKMRDAAIKFALNHPGVHTVCCGFRNFDHLDAYLPLSGTRLDVGEKKKLAAYKEGCGSLYCRHACGACEPSCPKGVPVNTIMRYNHYYEAQGKEKYAIKSYAALDTPKADLCAECNGRCEAACPYGVPVQGLLSIAHRTLSLT
ncbi:MAG: twin-arginine translocation signal domain-containing protein [bacterium]|nr:twin-arginine translocation signal domain-containing protein [bacterium]